MRAVTQRNKIIKDYKYDTSLSVMLDIFDGPWPVSVYDTKTKTYHPQETGFDCTAFTVQQLIAILGKENVVLK